MMSHSLSGPVPKGMRHEVAQLVRPSSKGMRLHSLSGLGNMALPAKCCMHIIRAQHVLKPSARCAGPCSMAFPDHIAWLASMHHEILWRDHKPQHHKCGVSVLAFIMEICGMPSSLSIVSVQSVSIFGSPRPQHLANRAPAPTTLHRDVCGSCPAMVHPEMHEQCWLVYCTSICGVFSQCGLLCCAGRDRACGSCAAPGP